MRRDNSKEAFRDFNAVAAKRIMSFQKAIYNIPEQKDTVTFSASFTNVHRLVRTVTKLVRHWLHDESFPLASRWISDMTNGAATITDENEALEMLKSQTKKAKTTAAEEFQMRNANKILELEESTVCHLSDLVVMLVAAKNRSATSPPAPDAIKTVEMDSRQVPLTVPSLPSPRGSPDQRAAEEEEPRPLTSGRPIEIPSQPASSDTMKTPRPRMNSNVNLGIAQVVCRPGSVSAAQASSSLQSAVENFLQGAHEAKHPPKPHYAPPLENIFTVERMKEIRGAIIKRKAEGVESVLETLRSSPRVVRDAGEHGAVLSEKDKLSASPSHALLSLAEKIAQGSVSIRPKLPTGTVLTPPGGPTSIPVEIPTVTTFSYGNRSSLKVLYNDDQLTASSGGKRHFSSGETTIVYQPQTAPAAAVPMGWGERRKEGLIPRPPDTHVVPSQKATWNPRDDERWIPHTL